MEALCCGKESKTARAPRWHCPAHQRSARPQSSLAAPYSTDPLSVGASDDASLPPPRPHVLSLAMSLALVAPYLALLAPRTLPCM